MRVLLALLLILLASPAWAAIARVDQGTDGLGVTGSAAAGTTVTVELTQAAVADSCLVAFITMDNTNNSVSSISGGGVTWVKGISSIVRFDCEIWYGLDSTGVGTTITITMAGGIGSATVGATVVEFSGVLVADAIDGAGASNNGSSTTPTTETLTPTEGLNEVILACEVSYEAMSAGPTNSFVALNQTSTSRNQAYLLVTSTSGSYSTAWTTGNNTWETEIMSLKATPDASTGVTLNGVTLNGVTLN